MRSPSLTLLPHMVWCLVLAIVLSTTCPSAHSAVVQPEATAAATTDCLSQLANRINPSWPGSFHVVTSAMSYKTWMWDLTSHCWYLGTYQAVSPGALPGHTDSKVILFIYEMGGSSSTICTPAFLAKAYKVLYHELLHFCCPAHAGQGSGGGDFTGTNPPPSEDGSPPDCNDLNYRMQTAKGLCDEIARAAACCKGSSNGEPGGGLGGGQGGYTPPAEPGPFGDPGSEDCEGLKDEDGLVIPGLEAENLGEYCAALQAEHDAMQDETNNATIAEIAFDCACGAPPWTPGTSPGGNDCCPDFIPPANGCKGTAAETYPNSQVIPDCSTNCNGC